MAVENTPDHYYVAYIDEAGDPGLKAVRPIDRVGGTEWLCLAAVVTSAKKGQNAVEWVRSISNEAGIKASDIHFRNLPDFRKRIVCSAVAKLPLRAFVLASNKKNMRQYRNLRAERLKSQQWFYNFCLRMLLERVTHFCFEHAKSENAPGRLLKIVYSERGGHSYGQTVAYHELLKSQSKAGTMVLTKRRIFWEVLDWRLAEAVSHRSSAGAQLADVVASSFYQAIDTLPPAKWDSGYAKLLKPIMAKDDGTYMSYGLALQPTPPSKAQLTDQQKEIFEFYGYKFWP